MKSHTESPVGKHRRKPPRIGSLIIAFAFLICTLVPIYYFSTSYYSIRNLSLNSLDHHAKENSLVQPLPHEHELPCSGKQCNPIKDDDVRETSIKSNMHDDATMWLGDSRPSDDILNNIIAATNKPSGRRKGKRKRGGKSRGRGRKMELKPKQPLQSASIRKDAIIKKGAIIRKGDNLDFLVSQVSDSGNSCDLFSGEWVNNPDGPYYTNMTCSHIQEHQNCMRFGRPDDGFLKWKWRPDNCELPVFDPHQFLEIVRGKSLAFVGDSVARNHMQSLLCLLSRVVLPIDLTETSIQTKRFTYPEYDFNISMFWAPYLVKAEKTDPNDVTKPFNLFLDEFDDYWPVRVESADYIIISAGHWFFRPTMFYVMKKLVGCLYCHDHNVRRLNTYFSYRRAFRTALDAINNLANFSGVTFLRTFAPSHFEGGAWDKGGDCRRTEPFKRDEVVLSGYNLEMYKIQLDELRVAQRNGRRKGKKFKLFDGTRTMLLRPDGHPSRYGYLPNQNVALASDCVHWCLPGPLDALNDFLQELLIREIEHTALAFV